MYCINVQRFACILVKNKAATSCPGVWLNHKRVIVQCNFEGSYRHRPKKLETLNPTLVSYKKKKVYSNDFKFAVVSLQIHDTGT